MSHQVRLSDDLYERIKANKREGESFSDAIERLIENRSLRDLGDVFDDEQVDEMRDAIEAADQNDVTEVSEVADRFE
ncbi:antitoxin VapB family protein [Halorussus gelatinilyticus]|uniref:Antitoxin VapB family protein n=1 Tax=Halorussus gelatinilyticus TaxID=2937524 RepID=A0A8U0IN33_9EURY|nr:antitoxin VapB family protein [Halorussus gelatinilyticus]UPW01584.1 antitoxin VapB family protein [Halorussus gelatinilyticus]